MVSSIQQGPLVVMSLSGSPGRSLWFSRPESPMVQVPAPPGAGPESCRRQAGVSGLRAYFHRKHQVPAPPGAGTESCRRQAGVSGLRGIFTLCSCISTPWCWFGDLAEGDVSLWSQGFFSEKAKPSTLWCYSGGRPESPVWGAKSTAGVSSVKCPQRLL